jgi:hypothetical protein
VRHLGRPEPERRLARGRGPAGIPPQASRSQPPLPAAARPAHGPPGPRAAAPPSLEPPAARPEQLPAAAPRPEQPGRWELPARRATPEAPARRSCLRRVERVRRQRARTALEAGRRRGRERRRSPLASPLSPAADSSRAPAAVSPPKDRLRCARSRERGRGTALGAEPRGRQDSGARQPAARVAPEPAPRQERPVAPRPDGAGWRATPSRQSRWRRRMPRCRRRPGAADGGRQRAPAPAR